MYDIYCTLVQFDWGYIKSPRLSIYTDKCTYNFLGLKVCNDVIRFITKNFVYQRFLFPLYLEKK